MGKHKGPIMRHVEIRLFFALTVGVLSLVNFGCSARQAKFESPMQATEHLVAALRADDKEKLSEIVGPESKAILASGDEVADTRGRTWFLEQYEEKHEVVYEGDDQAILQVGADDWPMPIPIVREQNNWRFDTKAGKDEILNRRVGRNELHTIDVCRAIVDAQRDYYDMDPDGDGVSEYAAKFVSDPDEKNGLYWEAEADDLQSPIGEMAAEASREGYTIRKPGEEGPPRPYYGYYYQLLTEQGPSAAGGQRNYFEEGQLTGGFAVVAWPAEYGNSGVMTFIVSHRGIVYEADLGKRTDRIARNMTAFDPDPQWRIVE